jgi:3-oxoacyl-[acyl-carrier-protein] synthase II
VSDPASASAPLSSAPLRRVVVTGLGLVTCLGVGTLETWRALVAGRSGIAPIRRFDPSRLVTRFAGEVRDFDPLRFLERKEARRMSRFQQFAVAAADMALEDAALRVAPECAERVGVIIGTGVGGLAEAEECALRAHTEGPETVGPFFILQLLGNLASSYIALRHGLKGASWSTNSACATGAHAIGESTRAIQRGQIDVAIAGGSEAGITLMGMGGFNSMRALSTLNEDPEGASRPFDRARDGFVMSEGAGVVILESAEHAAARGASVYAEVAGYGSTSDAHHLTTPAPEHDGGQRCMRMALGEAAIRPDEVQYVNAHATATPLGDVLEARGIRAVFGEAASRLLVSSTKSMMGHMLGAAGAVEAAICALAIRHGIVPPTINLHQQDPGVELDCVPNVAREARVDVAMSNSFGFGGTNATLVLRRA